MADFHGRFIWHELRVADLAATLRFYENLFGWATEEAAMGRAITVGGEVIGGISVVKAGVGSHWTPSIGVDDVDAAAAAALANGGIVTSGEPADVPGQGRIAPILDPHKSIFAAYRPLDTSRLRRSAASGGFVWDRLRTPHPTASADFYRKTIGWTPALATDQRSGTFHLADGTRVAEFVAAGAGGPTGWLPFISVADLAGARTRATTLGATRVGEPVDIPGVGSFAVIDDLEGASLAVLQAA